MVVVGAASAKSGGRMRVLSVRIMRCDAGPRAVLIARNVVAPTYQRTACARY